MRRLWICLLLALLGAFAGADLKIIDRTAEPRPWKVTSDLDLSDTWVVDRNLNRPTFAIPGGNVTLKVGRIDRPSGPVHRRPDAPGIGAQFDGVFLPKPLVEIPLWDFDQAAVWAGGTFHLEVGEFNGDTFACVTSMPDGTYGVGSTVKVGTMSGYRFGILAGGQQDFDVSIGTALASLWPADAREGPGHTFYGNELRLSATSALLGLRGVKLRIGVSRSVAMAPNVRADHVTAKFKGSWGVDYECLDDTNAGGAVDQYNSCGVARVRWTHPGGDAENPIFLAFRSGYNASLGAQPPGNWVMDGSCDWTKAPDQTVPSFRWETAQAVFWDFVGKGLSVPVFWPGVNKAGYSTAVVN